MVSRRKILSRSRDDLNLDQSYPPQGEEEDVWYQKDKLFKEHIQEVLDKWTQIDDEIWAKVIVFERNRRVAKAYARAPVLTINGSDDGFDGMRIGLCGFDNPMRDPKTEEVKRHIGQGVKIKMDDAGNILIRRYAKGNVYIKSTASTPNEETAIGADILKLPNQALESEKIVKLFDMKKFQSNVNRELRRAYPDRRRLETQCLSAVAFVKSESDVLECPVWVLIVNVVAMDMLKSKLPPVQRPVVDIKNRPRIPIPDEDPYSVAGNSGGSSGSSGFGTSNGVTPTSSGHVAATREQLLLQTQQLAARRSEKPPKLPPRDIYGHDIPKPDYDDLEAENQLKTFSRSSKSDKGKDNKKYDDPYYCGLRARVPNFVKTKPSKEKDTQNGTLLSQKKTSVAHIQAAPLHGMHPIYQHQHILAAHHQHQQHLQQQQQQQLMWHARSYESGIGIYSSQMNYMIDPHHPYACTTASTSATANGGGVGCPFSPIYGHTTTNNNAITDTTPRTIDPNMAILNATAGLTRLHRQHQPCYRTCSTDCYINPTNNTACNPIYGYYGIANSNKCHSENDILNLDLDNTTDNCESKGHKKSISSPNKEQTADSRKTSISPKTHRNLRASISKPRHHHSKHSPAKSTKSQDLQPRKTDDTQKSTLIKKSASIESFFQQDLEQPKSDEIYEKVKSGDEIYVSQKKQIDEHLRALAEKDNRRQQFLLRASKFNNNGYCQSEGGFKPIPRIYERPSRNPDRKTSVIHGRRERSMYDYRMGNNDSDLVESPYNHIYGRLPLPTRGYVPAPRTMYIGEWD